MKPVISIIIPNHNCSGYIADTLESVRTQTFKEWECIIIDDASTDDSLKIIGKFIKKDKRFRLIKNAKNIGISGARNKGLESANGEYIAFLDADDLYFPCALEALLFSAKSYDADIVGGSYVIVPDDFHYYKQGTPHFDVSKIKFSFWQDSITGFCQSVAFAKAAWIWRRLFRKECLNGVWFPENITLNEDLCFMLSALGNAKNFVEIDSSVVWHRIRAGSASSPENRLNDNAMQSGVNVIRFIQNNLEGNYPDSMIDFVYQGFSNTGIYSPLSCLLKDKSIKINKEIISEIRKLYGTRQLPSKHLRFKDRWHFWAYLNGHK